MKPKGLPRAMTIENFSTTHRAAFDKRLPAWMFAAVLVTAALFGASAQAAPFAYVADQAANTVSVIDTGTNTLIATVPVGSEPAGVAITPNGAFAYVTNYGGSTVSVIATATNTVTATVTVGSQPLGVAVTPTARSFT
jgi:YVTN family beta-propeller protein